MSAFGTFSLDREGDLRVDLSLEDGSMRYVISTPNHHTGNLITNLARVCRLPVSEDSMGLKVICGQIPCFVDGDNREVYIFRLGSTKVANIFPDGTVERKASVSAIVKTLMSQSKDFSLPERETLIKSYIPKQVKFRTDVHTHMNGILEPDILMAMGIMHEIRYPFYYVRKLGLELTGAQLALAMERRKETEAEARASGLTGRYLERRMDDLTYLNFADIVLGCPEHARENLARIRNSLTVIKDGQAVFANLETWKRCICTGMCSPRAEAWRVKKSTKGPDAPGTSGWTRSLSAWKRTGRTRPIGTIRCSRTSSCGSRAATRIRGLCTRKSRIPRCPGRRKALTGLRRFTRSCRK